MEAMKVGSGFGSGGTPIGKGREAAHRALAQLSDLKPSLALLAVSGREGAAEVLQGVTEVLGDCPLVGVVSPTNIDADKMSSGTARLHLVASPHLQVKIGHARGEREDWQEQVSQAFGRSYVGGAEPGGSKIPGGTKLRDWYHYRHPSIAMAALVAPPPARQERERILASFLRKKLLNRIPFMTSTFSGGETGCLIIAEGELIDHGVAIVMVKTDLQFSLERFHNFEPTGWKLYPTRTHGRRVLEFNGRSALAECLSKTGDEEQGALGASSWLSIFPLAHRGRDGRYHLFLPEPDTTDGSLTFPMEVDPDLPFFVMEPAAAVKIESCFELVRKLSEPEIDKDGCAFIMQNRELRDVVPSLADLSAASEMEHEAIYIGVDRSLRAYFPMEEWEGETSHLSLVFHQSLEPIALATIENERLLEEVMHLKALNQSVVDGIGYGIAVFNNERRVMHINRTYTEMVGCSKAELMGKLCPWMEDGDLFCEHCVVEEAAQRSVFATREVEMPGEEGPKTLRIECFPLREREGQVTAVIEVIKDISLFKELRSTLVKEQKKMEAIVGGIAESLYIVDHEYSLSFYHLGAIPHLSAVKAVAESKSDKCYEKFFQRDFPCPWCGAGETIRSGKIVRHVAQVKDEGHKESYYQITFSPWHDDEGQVQSVICLLVDITPQRQIEQQLIHSEKLNSLSVLSAGMAHELNNPLGAINFNLDVLKMKERDPEKIDMLDCVKNDVGRINRIVGNLLTFSRGGGRAYSTVSLGKVVDSALELFHVVIGRKDVSVEKSFPSSLPLIWGHFQDLQQVFINLTSNAVDAMPAGGKIGISASCHRHADDKGELMRIAVVYNHKEDISFLGALQREPGWETTYLQSETDVFDYFHNPNLHSPDVLVLDCVDLAYAGADRLLRLVQEISPSTKLVIVEELGSEGIDGGNGRERADCYLSRPLAEETLLETVRGLRTSVTASRQNDGWVEVVFSDTGIGIPLEKQGQIFDPFMTTKDENKGTGLGLSVVHKILERHEATIRVQSKPGHGTIFTIRFPLNREGGFGAGEEFTRGERVKWNATL